MSEQPRARAAAIVALGANLGDARVTLAAALAALDALPAVQVQRVSALYRSAPVDASGPDFLNAAALIHTRLAPLPMLHALHAIEAAHQRQRPYPNAPRTLDLDLIAWDENAQNPHPAFSTTINNAPELIIPHPRWKMRAFVLWPVQDIATHIIEDALLKSTQHQAIERIAPIGWHNTF